MPLVVRTEPCNPEQCVHFHYLLSCDLMSLCGPWDCPGVINNNSRGWTKYAVVVWLAMGLQYVIAEGSAHIGEGCHLSMLRRLLLCQEKAL